MKRIKINKARVIIFILIVVMVLQTINIFLLIDVKKSMSKAPDPVIITEKVEVEAETEVTTEVCTENVTTQSISEAVTAEDFMMEEETTEVTTESATEEPYEISEINSTDNESPEMSLSTYGTIVEEQPQASNESILTPSKGVNYNSTGYKETYYNLPMGGVVDIMRGLGFDEGEYPYWVREDGVKMLGDYVMVAANLDKHPRGSLIHTSLGLGIVCDTGSFAIDNPSQIDIAVDW